MKVYTTASGVLSPGEAFFETGEIPKDWLRTKVISILKPVKDAKLPLCCFARENSWQRCCVVVWTIERGTKDCLVTFSSDLQVTFYILCSILFGSSIDCRSFFVSGVGVFC
jgi:hypothetical protein